MKTLAGESARRKRLPHPATVLVVKPAPILIPALAFAQSLSGWSVPPAWKALAVSSGPRRGGCHSTTCLVLLAPGSQPADAVPSRGHTVRLRGWTRIEPSDPFGRARMWLDVNLLSEQKRFSGDVGDRLIPSEWKSDEITGEVSADAESADAGLMFFGKGRASIDGVTFEILPGAPASRRDTFQKLYARQKPAVLPKLCDGLIFVGEGHPTRALGPQP